MIRRLIFVIGLGLSCIGFAQEKPFEPKGFLWYNLPKEEKRQDKPQAKGVPFESLSYSERDAVLEFWTMEALHKARQTKSLEDMKAFIILKNYWLGESTEFAHLFQKALLDSPELDYNVTHPTSSIGTKLLDEQRELKRNAYLKQLSKTHGLMFFYRGESPYDIKQIPILTEFAQKHGLALMPVSVDGKGLDRFEQAVVDNGQADKLGVHFFPAILMVNPKTGKYAPVAFGLTTGDVLKKRLYDVATNFKGDIDASH